jgi:F-type H+-transporting ATPase subunit epsilon
MTGMAEGLKLEIVSPERLVLSQRATAVTVPGTEGYFTVMAGHAPFMTTLRTGFITVAAEGSAPTVFFVRGGFADVSPEGLTILAEESVPFAELGQDDLQARIRAAEQTLAAANSPEERTFAQEIVSGLLNLAQEAQHLNGTHIH